MPGSVRRTAREVAFTAEDAVAAWKGFFAVLLLGWSATDEVFRKVRESDFAERGTTIDGDSNISA